MSLRLGRLTSRKFLLLTHTPKAFLDPNFSANYVGATNAGLIRGAYHFAHPDSSSGATQANYFLAHGGKTAPLALPLYLKKYRRMVK